MVDSKDAPFADDDEREADNAVAGQDGGADGDDGEEEI